MSLKARTGCLRCAGAFYLSISLHRLQVFWCREEAELGAGHVVRQSPPRGCGRGVKKHPQGSKQRHALTALCSFE